MNRYIVRMRFRGLIFLMLLVAVVFFQTTLSFAAEDKEKNVDIQISSSLTPGISPDVQFVTTGALLYFFDPAKKTVYIYNGSSGRLVKKYEITQLGEDMKKSRD